MHFPRLSVIALRSVGVDGGCGNRMSREIQKQRLSRGPVRRHENGFRSSRAETAEGMGQPNMIRLALHGAGPHVVCVHPAPPIAEIETAAGARAEERPEPAQRSQTATRDE